MAVRAACSRLPLTCAVANDRSGAGAKPLRTLGEYLGLLHPDDDARRQAGRSRYARGLPVARRLDEDIDDLRARVAELERRLDQQL